MESRGAALPDDGVSDDRAISRTVLADQVRDRLLEAILAGHYAPNSRIVETRVARELGTSQAPVRAARCISSPSSISSARSASVSWGTARRAPSDSSSDRTT